jgi:hypothetical protein
VHGRAADAVAGWPHIYSIRVELWTEASGAVKDAGNMSFSHLSAKGSLD